MKTINSLTGAHVLDIFFFLFCFVCDAPEETHSVKQMLSVLFSSLIPGTALMELNYECEKKKFQFTVHTPTLCMNTCHLLPVICL